MFYGFEKEYTSCEVIDGILMITMTENETITEWISPLVCGKIHF